MRFMITRNRDTYYVDLISLNIYLISVKFNANYSPYAEVTLTDHGSCQKLSEFHQNLP